MLEKELAQPDLSKLKKLQATEVEPKVELKAALKPEPVAQPDGNAGKETVSPPPRQHPLPIAVAPQPVPSGATLKHPSLYFNQELGWLDFNWRVLHLAIDERTPLLERVRFVAITANNLDEFIQKRVGGLKRQEAAGVRKLSRDGRTPSQQLAMIREAVLQMQRTMTALWEESLKPALHSDAGVTICDYADLTPTQREDAHKHFQRQIYPILTPLTVDPGHPFPFISNLSLSLAVLLRHPVRGTIHFARLKLPTQRWVPIDSEDGSKCFLPVEQLVSHHISELFPGMEIVGVYAFRITRNADVLRDEEVADDLLAMISAELRERRFAPVVRLELAKEMSPVDRRHLTRDLGLASDDIYEVDGLLNLADCFQIADLDLPQFKYRSWNPSIPNRLLRMGETKDTRDIFASIRQGDLLVHHPYDSFTASTLRLIEEAAADERVLAIKQTLYRTSSDSPVIRALMHAAESGKQVAVLVEVKARFDEARNIEWAGMLENAGVHVAYGLVGLKTHTKATLIVRQEADGLRTYCHIGTGNYNPSTALVYTDLGLLTCSPKLGEDIVNLFHFLTGYAPDQDYRKAMVAPRNMRLEFNRLIAQEMKFQQEHGSGHIIAKMNALDDVSMIRKLYQASQAGVKIDLLVRGHSRLRPGLPGYSENIRIVSILGRFLEHDRIYYFHNNGSPRTFIGSADWRNRNLKRRVELIVPIVEPALQERLIQMLKDALDDNRLAWDLQPDGRYLLRYPAEKEAERDFHETMMKQARKRSKKPTLV